MFIKQKFSSAIIVNMKFTNVISARSIFIGVMMCSVYVMAQNIFVRFVSVYQ
jgi:hypothetical protein